MKDLTAQELIEAPADIKYLYMMSITSQAVGYGTMERAIKKHPKYFPDEIEHRRKWELIPESVHNQYLAERNEIREECYKDMPESKGIIELVNNPQSYKEWNNAYDKCREKEKPLIKALHKKHYEKYGIEYSGW